MSVGIISKRILDDIADAIRRRTGVDDAFRPEDMPDAIRSIHGGPVIASEKSSSTKLGLIDDSYLTAMATAIRDADGGIVTLSPDDMADAILSMRTIDPIDLVADATEVAFMLQSGWSGTNTKSSTASADAYFFEANNARPAGYVLSSRQGSNVSSMPNVLIPSDYTRLFLYVESSGRSGTYNTSTLWFRSAYGVTGYYGGNFAGENVRDPVTLTRFSGTAADTNDQPGVSISVSSMYAVPLQIVEIDMSGVNRDCYVGLHRCDNRTVLHGMVAAWEGFDALGYLGVS